LQPGTETIFLPHVVPDWADAQPGHLAGGLAMQAIFQPVPEPGRLALAAMEIVGVMALAALGIAGVMALSRTRHVGQAAGQNRYANRSMSWRNQSATMVLVGSS
jgi:hypothetical protein